MYARVNDVKANLVYKTHLQIVAMIGRKVRERRKALILQVQRVFLLCRGKVTVEVKY